MTATTQEEQDNLYNALRTKAINEGLRNDEDIDAEVQDMMEKFFGGVSYSKVRTLVEEAYPEDFI